MSMMEQYLGPILGLAGFGTAIATWFKSKEALNKDLDNKLNLLSERLSKSITDQNAVYHVQFKELWEHVRDEHDKRVVTETRLNVFWTIMEKEAPRFLKQHTTPEIDELSDKMAAGTITIEERTRLSELLLEEARKYQEPPPPESGVETPAEEYVRMAKRFSFVFMGAGIASETEGKKKAEELKRSRW